MRRRLFFSTDTENPFSTFIKAERESAPCAIAQSSTIFKVAVEDEIMLADGILKISGTFYTTGGLTTDIGNIGN